MGVCWFLEPDTGDVFVNNYHAAQDLDHVRQIIADLCHEPDASRQKLLKQQLKDKLQFNYNSLLSPLRANPFLGLDPDEMDDLSAAGREQGAEIDLLSARQAAAQAVGRRVAIFAMPKSGSTFALSTISQAVRLAALSLTSVVGNAGASSSFFGINGRVQELDELAILLQTARGRGSWVAQHHTCFTPYLGLQLKFYGIRPIVMVRNVFDAIVSMDDMIMETRQSGVWWGDPFTLPARYNELPSARRLEFLAAEFGSWLVKFYLSWRRGIDLGVVDPLLLRYETDVLDPPTFATKVAAGLALDDGERDRLTAAAIAPERGSSRFNKGVAGRGAAIPAESQAMMRSFADSFHDELGDEGMRTLFGETDAGRSEVQVPGRATCG